uniref:Uncharacterized protein n=1 Tax=Gasterosteus aculeatus TaxID=69293 RepID=G3NWI3_GASAC
MEQRRVDCIIVTIPVKRAKNRRRTPLRMPKISWFTSRVLRAGKPTSPSFCHCRQRRHPFLLRFSFLFASYGFVLVFCRMILSGGDIELSDSSGWVVGGC